MHKILNNVNFTPVPPPIPMGLLNCVFILLPRGSHLSRQIERPAVLGIRHQQNIQDSWMTGCGEDWDVKV